MNPLASLSRTTSRRASLRLGIAACAALAWPRLHAQPAPRCAMLLLHGKWGNPQGIAFTGRKLEGECKVETPEMPWSGRRLYDAAYPAALADLAERVKKLRAEGFTRIVLAGHSFGVNGALAYMAEIGDADAVIAYAPGHRPDLFYERGNTREAVDAARALVAQGKGSESMRFDDVNQGQRRNLRLPAEVMLSYFDPSGLGDMSASAARFKKAVPVLMVVGNGDPIAPHARSLLYDRLPPHAASQYLEVQAGHGDTPDVAIAQTIEWLRRLP